jgi:heme/copper-type cytochrome/quinol oxidase subunit 2
MSAYLESIKQFFSEMFASGSAEASEINHMFMIFSILSAVMLAIVGFMVIGGPILYRATKQKEEPSQITGNNFLEITWTIIPLGIVIVLFILSLNIMKKINSPIPSGRQPDILVMAHQWWWDFRYPRKNVVVSNELHIPVGKKLLMQIRSADVIHSWWVPELGRKIDAIPGRINNGLKQIRLAIMKAPAVNIVARSMPGCESGWWQKIRNISINGSVYSNNQPMFHRTVWA